MHDGDCDTDDPIGQARRLIANGEAANAVNLLRDMLEQHRGGLLVRLLLARALIAAGDADGALEVARETVLMHPQTAQAAMVLGDVFAHVEQMPLAIAEYQRALRIDPDLHEARLALGRTWLAAGEPGQALNAIQTLDENAIPEVRNLAQRAATMRDQPRADAGYVRHLFDQFSADYDKRMRGELAYAAPEILLELASLVAPEHKSLSVLDLGCGTGLAGAVFRTLASRLDGIDLSPRMIEQARARGIYDSLWVGDIEADSGKGDFTYDLVIAADTFVYLGDLSKVLRTIAKSLRPGGLLLFTVEKEIGEAYTLGEKRRWRHSECYLQRVAENSGFTVSGMLDCEPRTEAGKAVPGLAVALQKLP